MIVFVRIKSFSIKCMLCFLVKMAKKLVVFNGNGENLVENIWIENGNVLELSANWRKKLLKVNEDDEYKWTAVFKNL